MPGVRPTLAVLLVVAAGGLLVLPDLLRGSQEAPIDPVQIRQPATENREHEHDRRNRGDQHHGRAREAKPDRSGSEGPATTQVPETAPEPSTVPVVPASPPAGGDDGDDSGGGGGASQGSQPGSSQPALPPPPAIQPPPAPIPTEDDDGDDEDDDPVSDDGADGSVGEDGDD